MKIQAAHLGNTPIIQSVKSQEWIVTPNRAPSIFSICSRCDQRQTFMSSGKFRVNANKRKLDVWLIYKCTKCDSTLNVEILARKPVASIDPDLLHGYMNNDFNLVKKIANDLRLIGSLGYEIEDVPYTLKVRDIELFNSDALIVISPSQSIYLRLDRVIAEGLNISRSKVDKLCANNCIKTDIDMNSLKKKRLFEKAINLRIKS